MKHFLISLLSFTILLLSCSSDLGQSSIITVGKKGCDYTSLQEAVDAFTPEDKMILIRDREIIEPGIIISKKVIISGKGMNRSIISGGETAETSADRVFLIEESGHLTLKDLTVSKGRSYGLHRFGGGIANRGTVVLERVRISDNAAVYGVGIWNTGILEIHDSRIENNRGLVLTTAEIKDATGCTGSGGGIKNEKGGLLTMTETLVKNNYAKRRGGGVFLSCESEAVIRDCRFEENYAEGEGGAIHVRGDLILENSEIRNNESRTHIGGLYNKGKLVFRNNIIDGNFPGDFAMGDSLSGLYGYGIIEVDENNEIKDDRR